MTRPRGRKFKAISRPLRKEPSRAFPNPTRLTASIVHTPSDTLSYLPLCDVDIRHWAVYEDPARWTSEPVNCGACMEILRLPPRL